MGKAGWSGRAPLLGVIAIAFFIAAFAVGGSTPDVDSSGQKAIDFYTSNDSSQVASAILAAYGALFLALFSGALAGTFRRSGLEPGALPGLILGGGITMAIGFALFSSITIALTDLGHDAEPAAAQALNALNNDMFFPLAIGAGIFMLSTAFAALRSAVLPRWLGWVALVIGIAAVTPIGFFAILATGIWILVASVILFLGRAEADRPLAPPPAAPPPVA